MNIGFYPYPSCIREECFLKWNIERETADCRIFDDSPLEERPQVRMIQKDKMTWLFGTILFFLVVGSLVLYPRVKTVNSAKIVEALTQDLNENRVLHNEVRALIGEDLGVLIQLYNMTGFDEMQRDIHLRNLFYIQRKCSELKAAYPELDYFAIQVVGARLEPVSFSETYLPTQSLTPLPLIEIKVFGSEAELARSAAQRLGFPEYWTISEAGLDGDGLSDNQLVLSVKVKDVQNLNVFLPKTPLTEASRAVFTKNDLPITSLWLVLFDANGGRLMDYFYDNRTQTEQWKQAESVTKDWFSHPNTNPSEVSAPTPDSSSFQAYPPPGQAPALPYP